MAIIKADGTVSHVGLVLGFGAEHYNSSMDVSSFSALVWNREKHDTELVYVYDNFDNRPQARYETDATDEVRATYDALVAKRAEDRRIADELREAQQIEKGRFVQVVRGRKVPKGTRGQVFWIGNNGFGESIGFITPDGAKHFTAITNAVVAGHFDTLPASTEELGTVAKMQAESKAQWLASNPERKRTNDYSAPTYGNRANQRRYGTRVYR